jgi:ribonuclease-3
LGVEHYGEIELRLGYTFQDKSELERALTHRSFHGGGVNKNYEQLEFLGDAVFDLAVSHLLLEKYPNSEEGELSKMRAALVKRASLAEMGRKLEVGKYIQLSRGELASGASDRPSILSDVVEAILGAIYKEAGFAVAKDCVQRLIGDGVTTVTPKDPKTELQEMLHEQSGGLPVYKLECIEGPEHAPMFISIVEVGGEMVGRGRGSTKKESQQAAADCALTMLRERLHKASISDEASTTSPNTNQPSINQQEASDYKQGESQDEPER